MRKDDENLLVELFRSPEFDQEGRDGDHDGLRPCQTAVRVLKKQRAELLELREELHRWRVGDPIGDLIHANRDQLLKMHEEAVRRVHHLTQRALGGEDSGYGFMHTVLKVLDALNTFHPMHGESWKGWPEGSE